MKIKTKYVNQNILCYFLLIRMASSNLPNTLYFWCLIEYQKYQNCCTFTNVCSYYLTLLNGCWIAKPYVSGGANVITKNASTSVRTQHLVKAITFLIMVINMHCICWDIKRSSVHLELEHILFTQSYNPVFNNN